jgi:hypothetical protein
LKGAVVARDGPSRGPTGIALLDFHIVVPRARDGLAGAIASGQRVGTVPLLDSHFVVCRTRDSLARPVATGHATSSLKKVYEVGAGAPDGLTGAVASGYRVGLVPLFEVCTMSSRTRDGLPGTVALSHRITTVALVELHSVASSRAGYGLSSAVATGYRTSACTLVHFNEVTTCSPYGLARSVAASDSRYALINDRLIEYSGSADSLARPVATGRAAIRLHDSR